MVNKSQLYEQLYQQATFNGEKEALVEQSVRWTYRDLLHQVNRLSSVLVSQYNVRPENRVALLFWNQKEFLVSFYALRQIGAVVVPINIQLPPQDILYVLQNAGVSLILAANDLVEQMTGSIPPGVMLPPVLVAGQGETKKFPSFEEAVASGDEHFSPAEVPVDPSALSLLLYTSGTTGLPKGVMLSEENLMSNQEGFHQVLQFDAKEKMLLALPLFHAFGLGS